MLTCSWYSSTGISSFWPGGPNCLLTAEYLREMVMAALRLEVHIPMIPTRPPESAPRAAPNLLFGSYNTKTNFTRTYREMALFENNRLTIREQCDAIQNFHNALLTKFRHIVRGFNADLSFGCHLVVPFLPIMGSTAESQSLVMVEGDVPCKEWRSVRQVWRHRFCWANSPVEYEPCGTPRTCQKTSIYIIIIVSWEKKRTLTKICIVTAIFLKP